MASIKDVAERAGVGRATVSRVINNTGYVAEETRNRVMEAMEELNYTPNELARNLFRNSSGIVAVLIPSISHPFFGAFVDYIEADLYERGFKTMICCSSNSIEEEKEYLDMLNRHIVDGIISGVHSLNVEDYAKINGPIVALDRYLGENIPVVAVNHEAGGCMAAEELMRCGCRNVVHFRGAEQFEAPFHKRHEAFEAVMKKNNITTYVFDVRWSGFHNKEVFDAIESLVTRGIEFDGIFGVDLDAVESLKACQHFGLKVPEDVKIVAYDGTYITEMTQPQLTAVVQPVEQVAKSVAHHISRMIKGRVYVDRSINLEMQLRKGGTTT